MAGRRDSPHDARCGRSEGATAGVYTSHAGGQDNGPGGHPLDVRDGLSLGWNYRRLWTASAISSLGDGIRETAFPLLAATLTHDPALIAAVALAGRLPWLLFALVSGALVDRLDRRKVMWTVDAFRAVVMVSLAALVLTRHVRLPLLYAVAFLLGSAETLFDNASQAILPSVVRRGLLERANSGLYAAQIVSLEFIGPPLGAFLFAAVAALPFLIDGGSFLAGSLLVFSMWGIFGPRPTVPAGGRARTLRADIAEGLRWLWGNTLLRTLALMLGTWNLMHTAMISIFVLFALDTLHLTNVGYGLLFSAGAAGGLVGTVVAAPVARRLGAGTALLATVVVSGAAYLAMGLAPSAMLVAALFAVSGVGSIAWNIITVSLRQAIIPSELLGRANSAYRLLGWGMMPLGAALGGVLGKEVSLRSPFVFAGVVLLVMATAAIPVVNNRALEAARAIPERFAAPEPPAPLP